MLSFAHPWPAISSCIPQIHLILRLFAARLPVTTSASPVRCSLPLYLLPPVAAPPRSDTNLLFTPVPIPISPCTHSCLTQLTQLTRYPLPPPLLTQHDDT